MDEADISELAVAAWRLEKWLDNLNCEKKMAAKSALRSIKKYIAASGVEVRDPLGFKFDLGLAVEVVYNENEGGSEEDLFIVETISPYVYQHGRLIQRARVIIGTDGARAESNDKPNEKLNLADETEKEIDISAEKIERIMTYAKIL